MDALLTPDGLRERAARLPRVSLATLPTPLQDCPRLAEALGGQVRLLMKRDDLTGIGAGGNKVRKLEFSLGEALATGCDCVVHGLAGQSNYCRQTAAAAAKSGLPCHLVLRRDHKAGDPAQANRLLDYVFGAEVHMVEPAEQEQAKADLVERLRADGHAPYLIGYHDEVLGAIGYSLCLAEVLEQQGAFGVQADCVCVVTGGAGTLAGLVLGRWLLGFEATVIGFGVIPGAGGDPLHRKVDGIVREAAGLLGVDTSPAAGGFETTTDYAGEAYGVPTPGCLDAMFLLGRTEGLLAGPVYTAKGLAGLIDYVRSGRVEPGAAAVFVHTGGGPETYAYNAEIMAHTAAPRG